MSESETGMEVAVIGMSGRFPGAGTIGEFWRNLETGVESITFFSDEELQQAGVDPQMIADPNYVKGRGVLEDIESFDASFFGYTPAEARVMDPQVRVFHECAWEALEDAGYDPDTYNGFIGLFAGATINFFWEVLTHLKGFGEGLDSFTASQLLNKDYLTTRISYKLNLKGPSFFVQTACSTSLVAVHLACQSLLSGECRMALAGGVTIVLPQVQGYLYREGMVSSSDGHCRAFDAAADGTNGGSGAGVVLLKALEDAVEDRDHIYALIKGSAINNDGSRKVGFTAPSIAGQAGAIKAALNIAEVEPQSITYVETHGTGTPLGDPIEIEALTRAFDTEKRQYCALGAVKTNIGHLDAAAGAAGFIKTVLALKHRKLPPSLFFETPNSKIDFENSPFYVNTALTPWQPETPGQPLRAGVSSFGMGGTNAHVILEEWPPEKGTDKKMKPQRTQRNTEEKKGEPQLLLLSARSAAALETQNRNLAQHLETNPHMDLADVAYTLQVGRRAFAYRRTLVAASRDDAIRYLSGPAGGEPSKKTKLHSAFVRKQDLPVIFMFPGQGSQYVNMGRDLYREEPLFRQETDRCVEILNPLVGCDLLEILYPPGTNRTNRTYNPGSEPCGLDRTRVTQPLMFVFSYALAQLLMSWGIRPHAMTGYSFGEYTAACLAGVMELEDALKLIALRGKLMEELPPGSMLSVPLTEQELLPLLENTGLSLAIVNGPSCIVSGATEAVNEFEQRMKAKRLLCMPVAISHATHSAETDRMVTEFEAALRQVPLAEPRLPYISNVTGTWITVEQATSAGYWAGHLRETVRFADGLETLAHEKNALFLEVGPGRDLSLMARRFIQEDAGQHVLNLVQPKIEISDRDYLLDRLGRLWLHGVSIDWESVRGQRLHRRVPLPTYPFERKRYWIDGNPFAMVMDMQKQGGAAATKPLQPDDAGAAGFKEDSEEPAIDVSADYVPPQTPLQENITGIWQRFFGIPKIGIRDDFFELGGDSLKAMNASNLMRKELELSADIPVKEFFQHQTIEALARYIETHHLEQTNGGSVDRDIPPAPQQDHYPVSAAQKRLYVLYRLEPLSTGYNDPLAVLLEGSPDMEKITSSFNEIIRRHESLRTSFHLHNGQPVQRVHPAVDFKIGPIGPIGPIKKIIKDFIKPFDLGEAPLLRVALVRTGEGQYLFLVDMHHIISDGTSQTILMKEFMTLYGGGTLPPLRVQYKDYACWQNRLLSATSLEMKKQEAYWLERFVKEPESLVLPYDFPRPAVFSFEGATAGFRLEAAQTAALKALAARQGASLFMVLLTLHNILMAKLSGQEDIVTGSPTAGRRHADLSSVIGVFINTLALRSFPEGQKQFLSFLEEIKTTTLAAYQNQDYPFDDLVNRVVLDRDTGRNPLFDVMLVLQNMETPSGSLPGLEVKPFLMENPIARFDIAFTAIERGEVIDVKIEYGTRLFKPETIRRFIGYYKRIADGVLENPQTRLTDIDILPQEEKQRLLVEWNDTETGYPEEKTIHQLFEEQAEKRSEQCSVVSDQWAVTYGDLKRRVDRLALVLMEKGVVPEDIVGLILEPGIDMIAAILAVLKAGGVYLPIAPSAPRNRISGMLDDCWAKVVLTKDSLLGLSGGRGTGRGDITYTALLESREISAAAVTRTATRTQVANFDQLPFPNRSLVDYEQYNRYIGQAMVSHAVALQATRGCPYDCLYCHKIWPKKHVCRSAENIFQEVQLYYNIGVRRFVFIDDIFNFNRKNSSRFFQLIIENKLEVQLFFPNGMRGDLLTRDYIDLMVKAGTVNVALALETASPRLQKLIKKNLALDKLRENIRYICSTYPQVILELFTMHGFPGETEEEARLTLDFIKSLEWLHFPYVHVLKIFPDTGMEALALENGIRREDILSSMDLAFHELPETLPFDKSFTIAYQAEFLEEYFLSKERLLKVLPHQMKVLTEAELVQKYDSYLSIDIRRLDDLLAAAGLTGAELRAAGGCGFLPERDVAVPQLQQKIAARFPAPQPEAGALKVLLIDLSQYFSEDSDMLYDVVEPPLGLMYLMTHLEKTLGPRVTGKVVKSRLDFDSFHQLRQLLEQYRPDVIGIRTLSLYKDFFHRSAGLIRQWGFRGAIVAGGPYATSSFRMLLQDRAVDLVVMGEGEVTFAEVIAKTLDNGGKLPARQVLDQIPGIAFGPDDPRATSAREVLLLDQLQLPENPPAVPVPFPAVQPQNAAYIIYTSGSTGKPKGVAIEHRNVVRLMFNNRNPFDFSSRDTWTLFHSYNFDFSVWEMYGALLYGGRLIIVPHMVSRDPESFLELLAAHRVTVLNQTPSAFYSLTAAALARPGIKLHLRYVIFGGEALTPARLEEWKQTYPETKLINMYGITETCVHVTYKEIGDADIAAGISNIGVPIPTLTAYIMDPFMNVQPVGVAGELYVGGLGVARGYINDPQRTAEKFIHLNKSHRSYRSNRSYNRLYKSGDLVRWLPSGEMEYLGRIDHQVKIRGFRIELGEVENHLMELAAVKEAVVLDVINKEGEKSLCAYFVPVRQLDDFSELRRHLEMNVPDYMIPAAYVRVDSIPLTPNGKVDRQALRSLGRSSDRVGGADFAAAVTPLQQQLAAVWADVLELEQVGLHDNFFTTGGDSIKAIRLISTVNRELGSDIKLVDLFVNGTVEKLAEIIGRGDGPDTGAQNGERQKVADGVDALKQRIMAIHPQADRLEDIYPMSDIEKGMIFHSIKDAGSAQYHDQFPYPAFYPGFDPLRFKRALELMTAKHENLRIAFDIDNYEEPVQLLYEAGAVEPDYRHLDISHLEAAEQEAHLHRCLDEDRCIPFDVTRPGLWRQRTFHLGDGHIYLLWMFHHAIIDGWSNASLMTELNNTYLRLEADPGFIPQKLKTGYKRYVMEQLHEKQRQEVIDYWREELYGYKRLEFSPAGSGQDEDSGGLRHPLGLERFEKLKTMASELGTGIKHLCFAAYFYTLNLLTNESDIVAGLVTNNRPLCEDGDKIVGCFLNTVPVRLDIRPGMTWEDYIRQVDRKLVQLKHYDRMPMYEIAKLTGETGREKNPLFDTIFNFIDFHVYGQAQTAGGASSVDFGIREYESTNTLLDITVNSSGGSTFLLAVGYDPGIFTRDMILRICRYFETLLDRFIENRENVCDNATLFSAQERQQLLEEFNRTAADYPSDKTIGQLFREQAGKSSGQCSVFSGQSSLTYGQLNRGADSLASLLQEKGVCPGDIVALMVERSVEMIVGIMGILNAGAAYLPIDPGYPQERIDYMLKDSSAALLLTTGDLEAEFLATRNSQLATGNVGPANIAYIIYTSGTTGRPKGVAVTHRNVSNLVHGLDQTIYRQYEDSFPLKVTLVAPYVFDASVQQIFGVLLKGHALYIIPEESRVEGGKLLQYYREHTIDISDGTPTHIRLMRDHLSETGPDATEGVQVKHYIIGGEALPKQTLEEFLGYFQTVSPGVTNVYGPTECCVDSTRYRVDRENIGDYSFIPIGVPMPNAGVYILDRNSQLLPPNVVGELCISGDGVGLGYLNNPELTAEKFVYLNRSYRTNRTYNRIYKTGDLARWLPDGNLQFLGRIDQQVKIRGFRIELGEIENRLISHPDIGGAVVLAKEREQEGGSYLYLCAYVVPGGSDADIDGLREYLARSLPEYMIPTYFVSIEQIPVTPNGKLDMRALPEPGTDALTGEYHAPGNPAETALAEVMQDVLGLEQVGMKDNFFRLGGDSIKAIQVSSRLMQRRLKLEIRDLFANPELGRCAGFLEPLDRLADQGPVHGDVPLTPIQHAFFQQRSQGDYYFNQAVLLHAAGGFDENLVETVLHRLTQHHDALRMHFRLDAGAVTQRIAEPDPEQRCYSLEIVEIEKGDEKGDRQEIEARIEAEASRLQASFDIETGPLVKSILFKTPQDDYLFMAIHHLVVDTVSWRILLEDFEQGYRSAGEGKDIAFLPKTVSFKEWGEKLAVYAAGETLLAELEYWKTLDGIPLEPLPKDFSAGDPEQLKTKYSGGVRGTLTENETTRLLTETYEAYNTEINDLLLTALARTLKRVYGMNAAALHLEGHGREPLEESVDVSRTVGWFTSQFPVVLEMGEGDASPATVGTDIKTLKEQLRKIPNKGAGYGVLRYLTPAEQKNGYRFRLEPEISFNYLGQMDPSGSADAAPAVFEMSGLATGDTVSREIPMSHTLDITIAVVEGKLETVFVFNTHQYRNAAIEALVEEYVQQLKIIIHHCTGKEESEKTVSDFTASGMDGRELEDVYDTLEDIFSDE